jgi:hypothetical protein
MLKNHHCLTLLLGCCLALAGCQTSKQPPQDPVNAGDFFDLRPPGVKAAAQDAANDAAVAAEGNGVTPLSRPGLAMPSRLGTTPAGVRERPYNLADDMVKGLADADKREESWKCLPRPWSFSTGLIPGSRVPSP